MANDLTGDYDVVAAFSLGAVDRILAAMHRGNRLPHSLSMAVNDLPTLNLGVTAVSVVDKLGSALTDVASVKQAAYSAAPASAILTEEVLANVDPVVNWRPAPAGPQEIQFRGPGEQGGVIQGLGQQPEYSYLSGVAQLQLGPPIMELSRGETASADIHTPVMIRYVPDPNTLPLTDFMRGEIVTTFGVKEVASPKGTNIVVNVTSSTGNVHFNPAWSANSLDANDRAAINKALTKSLRNSFQPSSTPLPANLRTMHFKGFPLGGPVCVLMNVTTSNNPSPASVNNVFIRDGDHFALAVNGDAIAGPFADAVNRAIRPIPMLDTSISTTIDYLFGSYTYTFHIYTYTNVRPAIVTLGDIPVLDNAAIPGTGQIVLTIPVDVSFGWKNKPFIVPDPVNFTMNIIQAFTLTLNGREVGLQRLSDNPAIVFTPGNIPDNEKNPAQAQATNLFNAAWNSQQAAIQSQINQALSADGLQSFLKSLMNPKSGPPPSSYIHPANAPTEVDPSLAYTSFEIQPAGIVLHGALAVPRWPAAHVEFDKDPWAPASGPEYRALNSWIPGGTITQYQWTYTGVKTVTDSNRFITLNAPALLKSSNRICLTFTGSRITASGPIAWEPVSSPQVCKWTSIPLSWLKGGVAQLPHVIVPRTKPNPGGPVEVAGHSSPWAPDTQSWNTANFVVHFPDNQSAAQLDFLLRALEASGRDDTATALLCVLTKQQLATVPQIDSLMYADDHAAWESLLDVQSRPATVVLGTTGEIAWRQDGATDASSLADALRANLRPSGQFFPQFIEAPLRAGDLTPNFVFETAPGERMTLRKLAGSPVALVFWRSSSAASMATIGVLHRAFAQPGFDRPVVIAIADGEDGDFARGLAAVEQGEVIVVPDPQRQISSAYGIAMWPTTVFLDADGVVQDVRIGVISGQDAQLSTGSSPVPSNQPGKES